MTEMTWPGWLIGLGPDGFGVDYFPNNRHRVANIFFLLYLYKCIVEICQPLSPWTHSYTGATVLRFTHKTKTKSSPYLNLDVFNVQ